ncbi:MAG: hypothetical protein WKG03_06965 [Telluria sp.]
MNDHPIEGFTMQTQHFFEQKLEEINRDMREMRAALTEVARAMSKLAVLEERNLNAAEAITRLNSRVERVEDDVVEVKLTHTKFVSTADGVGTTMKWMWGAFGGGVIYLLSQAIPFLINLPSKVS